MELLTIQENQQGRRYSLQGVWTIQHADQVDAALDLIKGQAGEALQIDGAAIEQMDVTAAWLLHRHLQSLEETGVNFRFVDFSVRHFELFRDIPETPPVETKHSGLRLWLADIGRLPSGAIRGLRNGLAFSGHCFSALIIGLFRPAHMRWRSIAHHVYATGVQAIPIVALIALLISIVLAYQGATQLRNFGAEIFTIDLVAISVLREMGVLLTAIMVAGRSGSAFAAQIGVMKSNEEIDALRTMGLDPFEVLIVPRIMALVIALPLLTLLANITGLAGAALLSYLTLDVGLIQFLDRIQNVVGMNTFWVGIIKAPVFAMIIAMIGAYRGMQVTGSAESVGRLTTDAVVQSIFLVIAADAIFSIVFAKLGF